MTETRYKQIITTAFEFKDDELLRTSYKSYEEAREERLKLLKTRLYIKNFQL